MKIRMLKTQSGPEVTRLMGEKLDLKTEEAQALIDAGTAESLEDATETKAAEAKAAEEAKVENAAAPNSGETAAKKQKGK